MSPVTHLLLSWISADLTLDHRRDRVLAMLAGLGPDADGFGAFVEMATRGNARPLPWFSTWHHTFGHGLVAALVLTALVAAAARQRLRVALLVLAVFHLHLVGDLVGARGPDGHQWPVRYLWPFSDQGWVWSQQWRLDSWPNLIITLIALTWTLHRSWKAGRTPLEILPWPVDRGLSQVLRTRFGAPAPPQVVPHPKGVAEPRPDKTVI